MMIPHVVDAEFCRMSSCCAPIFFIFHPHSNSRSAGFLVPVVSARKVSVQPGPGPFSMLRSTCRVRAPATHISQTSDVRRAARAPARALHLPARTHFSMSLKYLKVCQLSSINGTPENKTDHSVSTKSAAPLVGTPKAVWLACCKVERHRGAWKADCQPKEG